MKRVIFLGLIMSTLLLCLGGLLVLPQRSLTLILRDSELLPVAPLPFQSLGQTSAVVALGGLNALVASGLLLEAFGAYESEDWEEVERIFQLIVMLQPQNSYYWKMGGWHLGCNAYFDYGEKLGMKPPRRRQKQKEYLIKAEQFLLQGTRYHPQEVALWQQLGRLFNSSHRPFNFQKAACYLKMASECSAASARIQREYFYTLGRVRGREAEALELGKRLMQGSQNRCFSSMRSLFFALQLQSDDSVSRRNFWVNEIWEGNLELAYCDLVTYWRRASVECFPAHGVDRVLQDLITQLQVQDGLNPFINHELKRVRFPLSRVK